MDNKFEKILCKEHMALAKSASINGTFDNCVLCNLDQQVRELVEQNAKLKAESKFWGDSWVGAYDVLCATRAEVGQLKAENERLQTAFSYTDKAGRVFEKQVEQLKGEVNKFTEIVKPFIVLKGDALTVVCVSCSLSIECDDCPFRKATELAEQFLAGK